MSYLPYGSNTPGAWALSGLGSVAMHGAVIALMMSNLLDVVQDRQARTQRPDFQISLEQLETDMLAGLMERLDSADLPDSAGLDGFPFDQAGEDLAQTEPDALAPQDFTAPDRVEPEAAEPLQPLADAIAPGTADAAEGLSPEAPLT
ncbi:hypothetical protein RGUI_3056 [Rhodovulum sp. P5]|uniref:hypothetical protein n=1 Tax=Rhodovulum sp. P5 TaxID=1564506 RepID=UPI0009C33C50|nr:hypothetical protein [Rhodovulum sp. P5]ARE41197.1 hypothetical protein RGUI_3056 [Rhodovulum sp. P5]